MAVATKWVTATSPEQESLVNSQEDIGRAGMVIGLRRQVPDLRRNRLLADDDVI